jgi:hypothetical protein
VAYVPITPYADQTYAIAYFADRLHTDAWDDAQSTDQVKALKTATRLIDNLNYAGEKHDETVDAVTLQPNQLNQFPRGSDTLVPDAVINACCELALSLLDDVDPDIEIENLQYNAQDLANARVSRDTSWAFDHVRAGIPSIRAWMLLFPFLRDAHHPRLELQRGD